MKFEVERNFLVRTYEEIDLDPKNFLHCATIEELNLELEDYLYNICEYPTHSHLVESEELGMRFSNNYYIDDNSFYSEWQRLKGLPEEL